MKEAHTYATETYIYAKNTYIHAPKIKTNSKETNTHTPYKCIFFKKRRPIYMQKNLLQQMQKRPEDQHIYTCTHALGRSKFRFIAATDTSKRDLHICTRDLQIYKRDLH